MNALSLFNGMNFCRMALDTLEIPVGNFYSSEIDTHANQAAQALFPDTIQLGDVTKWRDWDLDWESIDLVTGGFPCQSWSIAGKQLGDKDDRGKLFWVMLDIMKHVKHHNPKANFLIENVKMKKEFEVYITTHTENALGKVHKVLINSALVSAQNRNRYYWTSFEVDQPKDKEVLLKDILESNVADPSKSYGTGDNYDKGVDLKSYFEKHSSPLVFKANNGKQVTIHESDIFEPKAFYETRTQFGKDERKRLSKLNGRDTTPRDKLSKHYIAQTHSKANCIVTVDSFLNWIIDKDYFCRKLTSRECFRLQTVPEHHIDTLLSAGISNTQLYKMCGNGWTHNVIAHIFKGLR